MSTDKVEGDGIILKLIASMWGCRISIVRSDSCKEVRFRHDKNIDGSDFVLLYNCCEKNGHYSAVMHTDKFMIIGGTLKRFRNFNYDLDLSERRMRGEGLLDLVKSGDYAVVKSDDLKELRFKAKQYDKVQNTMEETEQTQSEFVEQQGSKGKKRQLGEDIRDPVEGQKECDICHKKFQTTASVQKHVDSKHRDIHNYVCKLCNKGFMNKSGYKLHKLTHRTESEKETMAKETVSKSDKEQTYVCKNTVHKKHVYFSSKRAHKKHIKAHTHPVTLYCYGKDKGCTKYFTNKGNLDQHWAICPKNDNKVDIYCEVCKDGPFHLHKKRNEHMRDVHGWRKTVN